MKFEEIKVGGAYKVGHFGRIEDVVYIDAEIRQIVTKSYLGLEVWYEENKKFPFKKIENFNLKK